MSELNKLLVGLIIIIAFTLRLIGLGTFMTADEPNWMIRSAEFWHNIVGGDFGGTFRTSHPGVTTMWLSGAGIVAQEQRLGLTIDQSNLAHFRVAATLPLALTTSLLIGLITWLLILLIGSQAGLWGGLFLAVDPYLTGMSQIVHLDALLALCMAAALLLFFFYRQTHSRKFLWWVGVFSGLALLNKFLPALWLLPAITAIDLAYRLNPWRQRFRPVMVNVLTVVGVAGLTIFLLWPALWSMHNINQYFERDSATIISDSHIDLEASSDPITPVSFYPRTFISRVPLVIVMLVCGVIIVSLRRMRDGLKLPLFLLFYAIGFLIFISLAAKKADRYALPALVIMPMLAGIALGWCSALIKTHRHSLAVGVILLFGAQTLFWSPYTIAFSNTWFDVRPLSQQGWGEGLEAAADWLNQRPQASELTIASWYPAVMGSYFQGKTMSLSSRNDHRVAYIVTYRNMGARDSDDIATSVLEELAGKKPVYQVVIGGVPYVSIYETVALTYYRASVGEILPGMEVGQTVPVTTNSWDRVDVGLATFNGRRNTSDLTLHIKENPDAEVDLRTVSLNVAEFKDSEWHTFRFEPLTNTAGKTFYLALTSANAVPGNAVSVHYSNLDLRPGQMLLRRRPLKDNETNATFLRTGDIAYRLK